MKIEHIMDKLEDYLNESTLHLIVSVEEEHYELAAEIRDEIDDKLFHIQEVILRHQLTKLTAPLLWDELQRRRDIHLKDWYEVLSIPNERRAQHK